MVAVPAKADRVGRRQRVVVGSAFDRRFCSGFRFKLLSLLHRPIRPPFALLEDLLAAWERVAQLASRPPAWSLAATGRARLRFPSESDASSGDTPARPACARELSVEFL